MASRQKPAETDPEKDESEPEKVVMRMHHSSGDTSTGSESDSASDTDSQNYTDHKKKKKISPSLNGVKDLFGHNEDDIAVLSEESGDECSNGDDDSCPDWATQVADAE